MSRKIRELRTNPLFTAEAKLRLSLAFMPLRDTLRSRTLENLQIKTPGSKFCTLEDSVSHKSIELEYWVQGHAGQPWAG